MSKAKHPLDVEFKKQHKNVKGVGAGAGACLSRHPATPGYSCSYRWQARERARDDDTAWYNYPAYKDLCDFELFEVDHNKLTFGKKTYHYAHQKIKGALFRNAPAPKAWDVDRKPNFLPKCVVPHFHQAHHILPNAVLRKCINESATSVGGENGRKLRRLICVGLLEAKYNLNHKDNMVILPMDILVGEAIKLPVHLEKGAFGHEEYSRAVKAKVMSVVRGYARAANEKIEDHKAPPAKLSKAKLEKVSAGLRRAIRAWGELKPGALLDDMTQKHIASYK